MSVSGGQKKVTVQYWDTTGQEKYRSLAKNYYKGANCCVLVYDITNMDSFSHLSEWKQQFTQNSSNSSGKITPFVVIGNKIDLASERKVPIKTVEDWCKENGNILNFEASALMGGLEKIFQQITEVAWLNYNGDVGAFKIEQKKENQDITIKRDKKGCC